MLNTIQYNYNYNYKYKYKYKYEYKYKYNTIQYNKLRRGLAASGRVECELINPQSS